MVTLFKGESENFHPIKKITSEEIPEEHHQEVLSAGVEYQKTQIINATSEAIHTMLSSLAPEHERNTWDAQYREALAYSSSKKAATPFIDALIEARSMGENKGEFIKKILAKAEATNIEIAKLVGKQAKQLKTLESLD